MATATQPKSSSAAVDVQNVAVENLSLESNSGKKASKWGLSKVFTTAFRRPSLGALSTSLPAANSEGEGMPCSHKKLKPYFRTTFFIEFTFSNVTH